MLRNLRPKNWCSSCHYEWYPRGKNRSKQCPDCGSRKTYFISWVPNWKKMFLSTIIGIFCLTTVVKEFSKNNTDVIIFFSSCIGVFVTLNTGINSLNDKCKLEK